MAIFFTDKDFVGRNALASLPLILLISIVQPQLDASLPVLLGLFSASLVFKRCHHQTNTVARNFRRRANVFTKPNEVSSYLL